MKKNIVFYIVTFFPFFAAQAGQLKCDYSFSGAPLGSVKLSVDENGLPGEFAEVALFFAPAKKMPVTNDIPEAGESLRLYIAKDDPNNELQMIVKNPQGSVVKSILINNSAPAGMKELQGICQTSGL